MGKENESKKTVEIPVEAHYLEEVVPPKCRNYRYRENATMVNVEVESFSGDDAPVALVTKEYHWESYDKATDEDRYKCRETPYRLANGKLYRPYDSLADKSFLEDTDFRAFSWGSHVAWKRLYHSDVPFEPEEISKDLPKWGSWIRWEETKGGALEELQAFAKELIVVDGCLWREANEPAYNVYSSLKADYTKIECHYNSSTSFEDGLAKYRYHYNANQWNEVVEHIQEWWQASYEPDFDHMDKIEVLIPEAVALPTDDEKESLHHMGSAVSFAFAAVSELEKSEDIDGLAGAKELASLLESHLRDELEELAQRWQRGCGEANEEVLATSVEAAYQELVS